MDPRNSDGQARLRASVQRMRLQALMGSAGGIGLAAGGSLAVLAFFGSWPLAVGLAATTCMGFAVRADRLVRSNFRLVERLDARVNQLRSGGQLELLEPEDFGAMAAMAHSYNRLFVALGEATRPALDRIGEAGALPERMGQALGAIAAASDDQAGAIEEVASLTANMNRSIDELHSGVETLSRAADESSSSVRRMGRSIDEASRNAGSLNGAVETCASGVQDMSARVRQVAASADRVQATAKETASAMTEMERAADEVSRNVKQAATLTEQVSSGAEIGSKAVSATIEDIRQIDGLTRDARDVTGRLAERIAEISTILEVISDINDETNLLSLNAAIIAAQAGEQGKAFLVVANHVKTLAQRTTVSTKDIERLIRAVQSESDNAVAALGAGIDAIEQGVDRSRAAGVALDSIRDSAHEASSRVAEITRATEEQARDSKFVAKTAHETSNQIQQISGAISEQLHTSDQLLQASESALDLCREVDRSSREQRETGRSIATRISSISELIHEIQQSTDAQRRASSALAKSVQQLLHNAQAGGEHLPALQTLLDDLRSSADGVARELGRFKTAARSF